MKVFGGERRHQPEVTNVGVATSASDIPFVQGGTRRNPLAVRVQAKFVGHWSWYARPMPNPQDVAQVVSRAKLRNSTTVLLVGNIEPTMEWYKQLGFDSDYYHLDSQSWRREEIEIFLQQQSGYVVQDDPGRRKREAWNVYIPTNNVKGLFKEYSAIPGVKIPRQLCPHKRCRAS